MIEAPLKNSIFSQLQSFVFISAIYSVIYFFNNWATSFLYLLPGAHLVHIPTGFKLLLVLIAGVTGALAIGFVSFINLFFFMFVGNTALSIELAITGGLSPFLVYLYFKEKFEIQNDLSWITRKRVISLGLIYALLNSCLIQLALFWNGATENFSDGLIVTFIGDVTGLYIVFLLIGIYTKFINNSKEGE